MSATRTLKCLLLRSNQGSLYMASLATINVSRINTIHRTNGFLSVERFVRTAACLDYSDSFTRLRLGLHQVLNRGFFW